MCGKLADLDNNFCYLKASHTFVIVKRESSDLAMTVDELII